MSAETRSITITDETVRSAVEDLPEVFASSKISHDSTNRLGYFTDQNVGVSISRPERETDTPDDFILVPRSYEATYETDKRAGLESARDQVIANMTGKTVIGVDTPGFGINPDAKRSFRQILSAAFTGKMKRHARVQIEAVKQAMEAAGIDVEDRDVRLHLLGYSMGAIAVVDMLGEIEDQMPTAKVESISMIEDVSGQKFRLLGKQGLLAAIGRETNETNVNRYLKDNADHGLKVAYDRNQTDYVQNDEARKAEQDKAKKRGLVTNLALGIGMRRGSTKRLTRELLKDRYNKTKIRLFRTSGSEVAREDANLKTLEQIAATHPDVSLTTIDTGDADSKHHHPIWQSAPAVAAIMYELNTLETNYVGRHRKDV